MSTIRKAIITDSKRIKELCDQYIGIDFYSLEEIENFIRDENCIVLVGLHEDVVIAFHIVLVKTFESACDFLHIPKQEQAIIQKKYQTQIEESIGIYKTIAISSEYRGSGLADELNMAPVDWLKEKGVYLILLSAIKRPDGKINAYTALKNSSFTELFQVDKPWMNKQSYCPYCQKECCQCNAVIFAKVIGE